MSAISRKVEWVKLRELRADEQVLVRKRYHLNQKTTTLKIQVVYTDQRIDSMHAPDCEWPRSEAGRAFREGELTEDQHTWAAGYMRLEIDLELRSPVHAVRWIPAPCTCGIVQQEGYESSSVDMNVNGRTVTASAGSKLVTWFAFVRPYLGLYATRGCPKVKKAKGEMPTLVRFVHRPLTLEQALEFEEVDDLGALRVMTDNLLEKGHPFGARVALVLHKHMERTS